MDSQRLTPEMLRAACEKLDAVANEPYVIHLTPAQFDRIQDLVARERETLTPEERMLVDWAIGRP